MKIGDVIYSTKVRGGDYATITRTEIVLKKKDSAANSDKEIRTKYIAQFKDGSSFIFYGFDIGKSVFKVEEPDPQIHLSEFMEM